MNIPEISPFKLLKPYGQEDLPLFFGRVEETRQLTDTLLQTKFILLYGASGTGKTSLIQCGLQGMFSPRDWLPVIVRRGNAGFLDAIRQALTSQYEEYYRAAYPDSSTSSTVTLTLRELIQALFDIAYVPVYLILDQFEELFTLGAEKEQQEFFLALQDLRLFGEDLFCKCMIVVREEYIAHFYRFEKQLPFLFEHRFRVEKMREEQLEQVVRGTLAAEYPGYPPFHLDAGAPLQIVRNLTDGHGEVELTTLQVYLDRLYREDIARISAESGQRAHLQFDLPLIGKNRIENVLADFLNQQLALVNDRLRTRHARELQQPGNIPLHVLFSLVTDQGTKRGRTAEDSHSVINTKKQVSASLPLVQDCFVELSGPDCRILNPLSYAKTGAKYYEIAHDRLADLISQKFNLEERRYREALSTIENRKKRFDEAASRPKDRREEYLSLGELELVVQSLNPRGLEPPLQEFLHQSRRFHERRRQRVLLVAIGLAIAAVVFLGVALYAAFQKQEAESAYQKAETARIYNTGLVLSTTDPTPGLDTILNAIARDPGNEEMRKGAYAVYAGNLFYKTIFSETVHPVNATAFSPDGETFAVAIENLIKIYHTRDTMLLDSSRAPGNSVNVLLFKGNDTLLAGSDDRNTHLFSGLSKGKPTLRNRDSLESGDGVQGIGFSKNGQWLCATYDRDSAKLWNLATGTPGKPIRAADMSPIRTSAFSPDGAWVATGTQNGAVTLTATGGDWSSTWHRRTTVPVRAISCSPDGSSLAVGFDDGMVFCWNKIPPRQPVVSEQGIVLNTEDKKTLHFAFSDSIVASLAAINTLCFSPDGHFFLAASENGTAKVFERATHRLLYELLGNNKPFKSASFTENGDYILTGDAQGTLRRWGFPNPYPEAGTAIAIGTTYLQYSPDGNYLFLWREGDPVIHILDTALNHIGQYDGHQAAISALSAGNGRVASADETGWVHLWNISSLRPLDTARFGTLPIRHLSMSANGASVLLAAEDSPFAWHWKTGTPAQSADTVGLARQPVSALTMDAGGRYWAIGYFDSTLVFYPDKRPAQTLKMPNYPVALHAVQAESGQYMAAMLIGAQEALLFKIQHDTLALGRTVPASRWMSWHGDGAFYADFDNKGAPGVYTPEGWPLQVFRGDNNDAYSALSLRPGGKQLAAATAGGRLFLWKIRRDLLSRRK